MNDGPLQSEGLQVNPDALEEENVVSSTLNPEFSRNSGAVVNQILKSGTNTFHGNAFYFYRDTFLNNGNYFSQTRPQYHQNLYGGTFGGPVFHNKLFFFLAYQGLRQRTGETQTQPTFSQDMFAGQFSSDLNYATQAPNSAGLTDNPLPFNVGGCIAGETWNQCFPNGVVNIPTNQWNSIASKLTQQFIPQANYFISGTPYYNFNANDTAAQDQGIIRVDYTPTSHDTVWASTVFQSSPSTSALSFGGGSFPGFGSVQAEHFKIFSAAWTHTFNASTLNELRAGYYRNNFAAVEPATPTLPSSYGFDINPQNSAAPGLPYISVGNYFNLGFSLEGPQPRLDTNMTFADNFTKVLGAHSLKIGGSYEQFRVSNPFDFYNNGGFSYGGGGQYSSGDPVIDFELGIPDSYAQTSNGFIDAIAQEVYAYAQDNWKISPDLTLNYGIAWDAESPNRNEQFDGLGIVCWANSNAQSKIFPGGPPGLTYPGDPGCNTSGGPTTHYNRFGPRVGFAWSPSSGPSKIIGTPGSHDFSVRGGYGIYYNRDQEEQSLQNLENPPLFYFSRGAGQLGGSPSFAAPFTDVTGNQNVSYPTNQFPFTVPTAGSTIDWADQYNELGLSTFDPKYNVPYIQNFNLNVQRSIGSKTVLQIGYVGSLGHNLASWYEGDQITPQGHALCVAGAPIDIGGTAHTCNDSTVRSNVHVYFPQFTDQPAIVPNSGNGAISTLPNGIPWYLSVARQNTENASNYNALQISLIQARTHGLSATFAYTYSHGLDNGSGYESTTGGPVAGTHVQIYTPGFTYLNYGDSDYDARHRFVTSYVYEIPITAGMNKNLLMREALGGWEIAGITTLQTGFPIPFSEGLTRSLWCDNSYFGCGEVPELSNAHLKSLNPRAPGNAWFDTSGFSPEPVGTFGNTKRNFFHGPGYNYSNLQLSKNFHLSADGVRYLQLRVEAFNAFNHANFADPGATRNSPNFGTITGVNQPASFGGDTGDPQPGRAVQLAGKFYI